MRKDFIFLGKYCLLHFLHTPLSLYLFCSSCSTIIEAWLTIQIENRTTSKHSSEYITTNLWCLVKLLQHVLGINAFYLSRKSRYNWNRMFDSETNCSNHTHTRTDKEKVKRPSSSHWSQLLVYTTPDVVVSLSHWTEWLVVLCNATNAWMKLTMYYYRYQDVTIVFQWALLLQLRLKVK